MVLSAQIIVLTTPDGTDISCSMFNSSQNCSTNTRAALLLAHHNWHQFTHSRVYSIYPFPRSLLLLTTKQTFSKMSEPVIPSIEEIRASTEILSPSDASATVVRVGQHVAVKFGARISHLEAENLKFVSEHSNVPVPKVLATMTEPGTSCSFIVMEYVEGQGLGEIWNSLSPAEKFDVGRQIQDALENLRKLSEPGYFGALHRQPLPDGIFWTPEQDPQTSGPFETEKELNEGIIRRLKTSEPASHIALLRKLMSDTLKDHHPVFTHGDLQPKNILVNRIGTKDDGRGEFQIKIIDWENAGWYPEYWEFCNSTIAGRFRPDWLDLVQQIMPVYPTEYLMLQAIRSLLFY